MTRQDGFFFLICGQLMRHPLIELFHLSSLLQMPSDCRVISSWAMSYDQLFDNVLCSCKRVSFDGALLVNFQWLARKLFIFTALVSFAELLEPPLHCMFLSSSWAKYVVAVESCFHCFMTQFELKLKHHHFIFSYSMQQQ